MLAREAGAETKMEEGVGSRGRGVGLAIKGRIDMAEDNKKLDELVGHALDSVTGSLFLSLPEVAAMERWGWSAFSS